MSSLFERFKASLTATSKNLANKIDGLFGFYNEVDDDFFEELEEILILADLGFETTESVLEELRKRVYDQMLSSPQEVKPILEEILISKISSQEVFDLNKPPKVILVIGVNGAGKTTSIGKLAKLFVNDGRSVLLAAGDTFRAAAIDQLGVWADRAGVDMVRHQEGSDPASVIYDAIQSAKSRQTDVLICDSAGRLHNKKNLMMELGKISKIIHREYSEEEIFTLLVLDATTGQNAISQAEFFKEYADIDGIVLSKMDGSSKGGFVFGIKDRLNLPVVLMTLGEKIDDIALFDPELFVKGIFDK
ncbi:MAG: signal recognition particle-docking protein FtsY [Tissierellia bacterium]|nr:signal recognition particle-docking protein FtsY [Tissierellia bacterium]